jgi:hypothetical protein
MPNKSIYRVSIALLLTAFVTWGCDTEAGEQTKSTNGTKEFTALGDSETVRWEIAINEQNISDRHSIERLLPPVIRGSADPMDTPPLVLNFQFDQPRVLGFHVDKVSRVTSNQAFDVRVNGELYHRKVTPWTDGDNGEVDRLYYIYLPRAKQAYHLKYSAPTEHQRFISTGTIFPNPRMICPHMLSSFLKTDTRYLKTHSWMGTMVSGMNWVSRRIR